MKVEVLAMPPDAEPAQRLLQAFENEAAALYDRGRQLKPQQPHGMHPPKGAFLVIFHGGEPIACGGLRALSPTTAEMRRMFIQPKMRGHGLGHVLLELLEREASQLGYHLVELETGERNLVAQALYASSGYERLPSAAYRWRKALEPAR